MVSNYFELKQPDFSLAGTKAMRVTRKVEPRTGSTGLHANVIMEIPLMGGQTYFILSWSTHLDITCKSPNNIVY